MSENTTHQSAQQHTEKSLLITMGIIVVAVAVVAIIGFLFLNKPNDYIEGQVEGTVVRVAGKLPGRIVEIYVQEGDTVHAGDTLVHIHSAIADAQLTEALAMQEVMEAQNRKVDAGTRQQIVQAAADMAAQAQAALTIAKKTYDRMENLYREGVVSEQKRDEAKAAFEAATAARDAAESQLSLARSGAQSEDKQASAAMVRAAGGGVSQVEAILQDSYLTAPYDGTIDVIFPEPGELVAMGAPVMNLLKADDRYIVFNVREELLEKLPSGKEISVMVPALGKEHINAKIYYIRDMGAYATWHSTKANGGWDSKTFQIKARPTERVADLRPGMTIVYEE